MTRRGFCPRVEHDLYPPILRGSIHDGWLLHRLPDLAFGRRPADFLGCTPTGQAVILEVKRVKTLEGGTLPTDRFELQQLGWLQGFANHQALALVGLWVEAESRFSLYQIPGGLTLTDVVHLAHLRRADLDEVVLPGGYGLCGWDRLIT